MRQHPYDQSALGPDAADARRQAIRNRRPIPPRHLQRDHTAKITVRIDWEHDGVEWIDADTIAYSGDDVLAIVSDPRMGRVIGVWVAAADVTRR